MSLDDNGLRPWAVVTSGPTSNSLGVVRGLGENGVPVALVETCEQSPARFSKYVRKRILCPDFRDSPKRLIDTLTALADGQSTKPVLLPTGDREVLAFARFADVLGKHFRFLLPDAECVETATDKRLFYEKLQQLGIPHPRTRSVTGFSELEAEARSTALPFLIKPVSSIDFTERFHKKLFVVRSQRSLERALQALSPTGLEVLIQEIIPVQKYYEVYCLIDDDGFPLAIAGWERLRQFPPFFGTASLCRSTICQEAVNKSLSLLQRLGIRGLAAVELLRDSRDNSYKVLEVNPRTSLQNRLAAKCGVDLEYKTYCHLTGGEPVSAPFMKEGLYWVDNFKDPLSVFLGFLNGGGPTQKMKQPWPVRKTHSVLSFDDVLPYPMAFLAYASKIPSLLHSFGVKSKRSAHSD
jgi:predicted ATP-grasp superfamily ATP-dependent carboligase